MDVSSPRKSFLSSPIRIRKLTFPDKNGKGGAGFFLGGGDRRGIIGSTGLAATGLSIVGGAVGVLNGSKGSFVDERRIDGSSERGVGVMKIQQVQPQQGGLHRQQQLQPEPETQPQLIETQTPSQQHSSTVTPTTSTIGPSSPPSPSSMTPHHLHLIRERTKQKVIEKARKGLREKSSPTVVRSMSSHGVDRDGVERDFSSQGSQDVRATSAPRSMVMSKPISLVTRIQQEVANCAFQDLSQQINKSLRQRRTEEEEEDKKAGESGGEGRMGGGELSLKRKVVRRRTANTKVQGQNKGKQQQLAVTATSSAAEIERHRLLAVARVMNNKKRQESKKKQEEEEKRKSKFGDIDLEQMRQLASQRALEAQREAKARREKEEKAREERRASKAREREREQEEKDRKRAEIYAINGVMREAFNNRFRQFAGNMLASGEGKHAIISDELEGDLEGVRQSEIGRDLKFRGVGAV